METRSYVGIERGSSGEVEMVVEVW